MAKLIDRVGMRYGRLTVVSFNRKERRPSGSGYDYYWNCKCDCGNNVIVRGANLANGNCRSCGCLRREMMSIMRKGIHVKYGVIPKFSTEKESIAYLYDITSEGRIFSRVDGREMSVSNGSKGYKYIRLTNPQFSKNKDGRKPYKVHRLVAMFHLPDYSDSLQVNHKNGDKADNRVENLEMVTNSQNSKHAWEFLDIGGERRRKARVRIMIAQRHKWVKVRQILDGVVIAEFDSISEAARSIGASTGNIWMSCKNGHKDSIGKEWHHRSQEMRAIEIYCGNCLDVLPTLPDNSIDQILTDLPYATLNESSEGGKWDKAIPLGPLWNQFLRVTKYNAAIVLFAQGMFSAQLMMSQPKLWRYNLVWSKTDRPSGFLNARKMPLRSHEDILVFYRSLPTYNPQMVKCEPHQRNHSRGKKEEQTNRCYGNYKKAEDIISDEKYPRSVLEFRRPHPPEHPTQKPVDLCRWLIRTYTNPGETVLDATCGSGTTGVAAALEGRGFYGIEKEPKYFEIAKRRIEDASAVGVCVEVPADSPAPIKIPAPSAPTLVQGELFQ